MVIVKLSMVKKTRFIQTMLMFNSTVPVGSCTKDIIHSYCTIDFNKIFFERMAKSENDTYEPIQVVKLKRTFVCCGV